MKNSIEISVEIDQTIDKGWNNFSQAAQIAQWYFVSPDWHCPTATIKLNGPFSTEWKKKTKVLGLIFWSEFSD